MCRSKRWLQTEINVPADHVSTQDSANSIPNGSYCNMECCHGVRRVLCACKKCGHIGQNLPTY